MKPFEIFRTGKHTSSQGATLTFGDLDLAAIVAGYDPDRHQAPIVVGHPKQDAPAYGWVKSLSVKGDRLVAEPDQVNADFSELVKGGSFKKVSAAFYQPSSPNNPTPGQYHLRHVGFLGAEAPAVKGLKAIEFADTDLVLEFADTEYSDWRQAWALDNIARMFRGIREYFIETKDVETADKLVSSWDIDMLTEAAAELKADIRVEDTRLGFSEAKPKETDMTTKTMEQRLAEIDARETALAAREAETATRETTFAERERNDLAKGDAEFVAGIVQAGRLPIGLQATATALFSELGAGTLTFAEGDQTIETSPRAAFRELLEKLPVQAKLGELATGDGHDFSDPQHVQAAIVTEIRTAKDAGEIISPATAAMRLKARG